MAGIVFLALLFLAVVLAVSAAKKAKKPTGEKIIDSGLLPNKTTPDGGLVFWVREIAPLLDSNGNVPYRAVDELMRTCKKDLPLNWVAAMAASTPGVDTVNFEVRPAPNGVGYEIWVDHSRITRSSAGKITVS